jgi:hypothetical protein
VRLKAMQMALVQSVGDMERSHRSYSDSEHEAHVAREKVIVAEEKYATCCYLTDILTINYTVNDVIILTFSPVQSIKKNYCMYNYLHHFCHRFNSRLSAVRLRNRSTGLFSSMSSLEKAHAKVSLYKQNKGVQYNRKNSVYATIVKMFNIEFIRSKTKHMQRYDTCTCTYNNIVHRLKDIVII